MSREKNAPLTPEDIQRIETLAGIGLNMEQIALVCDTSKKTLERRLAETPAARDAIEKGRAKALTQVGQTAYKLAVSGEVPAMTMFYLKCRGGWREKIDVGIEGTGGGPIQVILKDYRGKKEK